VTLARLIPAELTDSLPGRVRKRLSILCGILKEGDRVLDIGCGVGSYISNALGYLPVYVIAIDSDPRSIEYAGNRNQHSNVEYVVADGETFRSRCMFDVVICNHVLEHVIHPVPLLLNIERLLKPNGMFYLGIPNGFGCFEIENFVPRMLYRTRWGKRVIDRMRAGSVKDSLNTGNQHVQFFTAGRIRRLLEQTGWQVVGRINEEVLGGVVTDRTVLKVLVLERWNMDIAGTLPAMMANGWIFLCRRRN